jgi:hypothetical protein
MDGKVHITAKNEAMDLREMSWKVERYQSLRE